jgi:hypothetical protein
VAIDPTTPLTPIIPAIPAGAAPDSAVLQAMARAALANTANQLGEIVGRPTTATPQAGAPVEQASQTSTQDAGHAADAPSAKLAAAAQSLLATKTAPETRVARAVRTAAAEAVPRQAGLAPLMANVRAVVDRPDMPMEVREAGRALLAQTPNAAEIATPQGLRRAVERSGVFLEAWMARTAASTSPEAPSRPGDVQDLKAALLVFRGALSAWLAKAAPQVLDIEAGPEVALNPAPTADGEPATPQVGPTLATPADAPPANRPSTSASTTSPADASDLPEASPERASVAPGQQPPKTTAAPVGTSITPETAEPAPGAAQSPPSATPPRGYAGRAARPAYGRARGHRAHVQARGRARR